MGAPAVFALRLRAAREARGVSQKQLGILAGVDEFAASARINQYERGKHMPDLHTVQRLAQALDVPQSYLFEPRDDLATLIRLAGHLPEARLRALITMLDDTDG